MKKTMSPRAFLSRGLWTALFLAFAPPAPAAPKSAPPPPAALRVMSDPAGARVYLNGAERGETPLECEVAEFGPSVVRLVLDGHREWWGSVELSSGEARSLSAKLEPLHASVLVHTDPDGAAVALDGAHAGEAPLLLPRVPLGRHRLTVSQPGFQPRSVDLDVPNAVPQKVDVALVTDSATLRVSSEPLGAQVFLNGVPRGAAPVVLDRIPDGTVSLEVVSDGYQAFRQEIRLAAGDDESIAVSLDPLPATLQVVTLPAGARVYVADAYKGDSPVTVADLAPGDYRVRVELAAYDPAARTVTLGRAASAVEEFRLVPNCGSLLVTTSPAEVTVLVDGKVRGTTTAKPDASDQLSETLEIPLVAAGEREVLFTREGYHEARRVFAVERDKATTINVELRRRFIPDYEVRTDENVYKGVFQSRTAEFLRLETEPGVIRSFPLKSVKSARVLREDERAEVDAPPKR